MVQFYVTQIKLHRFDGVFTIDSVPAKWREAVRSQLVEEGFYESDS